MDYSVKAEEIPEEQSEFTDLWELLKKYYHVQPDSNEAYWYAVIKDADLYHKNHPSALALDFITAFLHDLERRKPADYPDSRSRAEREAR